MHDTVNTVFIGVINKLLKRAFSFQITWGIHTSCSESKSSSRLFASARNRSLDPRSSSRKINSSRSELSISSLNDIWKEFRCLITHQRSEHNTLQPQWYCALTARAKTDPAHLSRDWSGDFLNTTTEKTQFHHFQGLTVRRISYHIFTIKQHCVGYIF